MLPGEASAVSAGFAFLPSPDSCRFPIHPPDQGEAMFYTHDVHGLRFDREDPKPEPRSVVEKGGAIAEAEERTPDNLAGKKNSPVFQAYQKNQSSKSQVEPLVHAYQIMSAPVVMIHRDESPLRAWGIMSEHQIRHLPVIDDRRNLLGVLSEADVLRYLRFEKNQPSAKLPDSVGNLLSKDQKILTAGSMTDIRKLAETMTRNRVGSMPILEENGRLVGIVTRSDILKGFMENPRLNLWG